MVLIMDAATNLLNKPDNYDDSVHTGAETRGQKRKISLTNCDVCEADEAKYRCPGCSKSSCSLSCVKQHKLKSGCSGVRDRTAFLPVAHFSHFNLLSDYRFLEEAGRVAERPVRDSLLQTRTRLTFCATLLKRKATAAQVNLKILPKFFSKRKENTSFFNKSEQKLYWHLKLVFPQSRAEYRERVPEDRVLEKILSDYIHPTESDPEKRQRLKTYVLGPPDHASVFMKAEQRRPGASPYHELDLKKSLRANLVFKTVVEYPELHVVLSGHRQEYLAPIIPESRSTSHRSTSSEAQEPPEDPKKRKKVKRETRESELEEGEIRSEDEDGRGSDRGAVKDVEESLLHKDHHGTKKMNNPRPPCAEEDDDDDGDQVGEAKRSMMEPRDNLFTPGINDAEGGGDHPIDPQSCGDQNEAVFLPLRADEDEQPAPKDVDKSLSH